MGVKEEGKSGCVDYYYDVGRDDFFNIDIHYMLNPKDYIEKYVDSEMNAGQKNQYLLGIIDSAIVDGSLDVAFLYYLNIDMSENPEAVTKLIKATKKESVEASESLEDQLEYILLRNYSAKEILTGLDGFKEIYF
ncbi:MAG: hypothetical protein KAS11_02270 [Candidatus Aenigmarchaeota archaeon]|nr:hypothetical protein [Candidatus Aenigmarchaeota archaeon]